MKITACWSFEPTKVSPSVVFFSDARFLALSRISVLLLFLFTVGRDGKVCVFALSDFEELGSDQAKTKLDCKEHKLEKAKGNIRVVVDV